MKMKKKIIENNSKVSCHSSFIWCKRNGTEGLISKYEPTEGSDYLSERQILFGLRTTSQYYIVMVCDIIIHSFFRTKYLIRVYSAMRFSRLLLMGFVNYGKPMKGGECMKKFNEHQLLYFVH